MFFVRIDNVCNRLCTRVTMSQRTSTVAAANSKRSSSVLGAYLIANVLLLGETSSNFTSQDFAISKYV